MFRSVALLQAALIPGMFAAPFSYDMGGDDWGNQCSYGKEQSPIDINKTNEFHRGYLKSTLSKFGEE